MTSARRVIFRAVAAAAFVGLTIGGTARLSSANSGLDTGAGNMGYQGSSETGTGTGGSVDSGNTTGTDPVYRSGVESGTDSSTSGSGTGGSVDSGTTGTEPVYQYGTDPGNGAPVNNNYGTGTGGTYGTGTGGRTDCDNCPSSGAGAGAGGYTGTDSDQGNSGNIKDRATRGSTEGGVNWPDNSNVLGPSGRDYMEK